MSDELNEMNEILDTEAAALNIQQKEYSKKYLTFLSDGLLFGVNAAYVTEIITNHHITKLPMVPDFIKGIYNLRGQIIPIIDIRLRMHKPEMEQTDATCIIVLSINSTFIGMLVDTVSQVTDVYEDRISPPPVNNRQELINGIVSLAEGTTMLLLDCELLIAN